MLSFHLLLTITEGESHVKCFYRNKTEMNRLSCPSPNLLNRVFTHPAPQLRQQKGLQNLLAWALKAEFHIIQDCLSASNFICFISDFCF